MEKKDTRKNTRVMSNLSRMKNKMATNCLGITLSDTKTPIKLMEVI